MECHSGFKFKSLCRCVLGFTVGRCSFALHYRMCMFFADGCGLIIGGNVDCACGVCLSAYRTGRA